MPCAPFMSTALWDRMLSSRVPPLVTSVCHEPVRVTLWLFSPSMAAPAAFSLVTTVASCVWNPVSAVCPPVTSVSQESHAVFSLAMDASWSAFITS